MTLADTARPAHLRRAAGRQLRVITDLVTIAATAADTGGAYTLIESETPPGGGLPLNARRYDDASIYVLDGAYLVRIGGAELALGPGGHAFIPRGTSHGYVNTGAAPARLLMLATPGGVHERFLDEVSDAAGRADWAVDMARVLAVAPKYGIDFLTDEIEPAGGATG